MLDVICMETLGLDFNHLESDVSPLHEAFANSMQPSFLGHFINYINSIVPIRKYLPIGEARKFQISYDNLRTFIRLIVHMRIQQTQAGAEFDDLLMGLIEHSDDEWSVDAIVEYVSPHPCSGFYRLRC